MEESPIIKKLAEFLSTDIRMDVFTCFVLQESSQSDIVNMLNSVKGPKYASTSTIERITSSLNFMGIIEKSELKENKQYYKLNWHIWIQESLRSLDFKGISEAQIEDIEKILRDKRLITFYFIFTDKEVLKFVLKHSLNKEDLTALASQGIPSEMFLNYLVRQSPGLSRLPLFFILYGNPMKKLWRNNVDRKKSDNFMSKFLKLLNMTLDSKPCKQIIDKFTEESLNEIMISFESIEKVTHKLWTKRIKEELQS